MKLTTTQVAEKLGVTKTTVATLARTGKLAPVNKPENGKRVEYQFDSKAVMEFRKVYVPIRRGKTNSKANGAVPASAPGLLTLMVKRMAAMDAKLDQLIGMWS